MQGAAAEVDFEGLAQQAFGGGGGFGVFEFGPGRARVLQGHSPYQISKSQRLWPEDFTPGLGFAAPGHLGACAVGIHGCKSALIHVPDRSISLNIHQYSPQSTGQGRGDSEFSLSRIPTAQAPRRMESRAGAIPPFRAQIPGISLPTPPSSNDASPTPSRFPGHGWNSTIARFLISSVNTRHRTASRPSTDNDAGASAAIAPPPRRRARRGARSGRRSGSSGCVPAGRFVNGAGSWSFRRPWVPMGKV